MCLSSSYLSGHSLVLSLLTLSMFCPLVGFIFPVLSINKLSSILSALGFIKIITATLNAQKTQIRDAIEPELDGWINRRKKEEKKENSLIAQNTWKHNWPFNWKICFLHSCAHVLSLDSRWENNINKLIFHIHLYIYKYPQSLLHNNDPGHAVVTCCLSHYRIINRQDILQSDRHDQIKLSGWYKTPRLHSMSRSLWDPLPLISRNFHIS